MTNFDHHSWGRRPSIQVCSNKYIDVQHARMAIETDRLILRLFSEHDFASLRQIDSEPAVLRYRTRPLITAEMTRQFLDLAQGSVLEDPRTFYAYAIELKPGRASAAGKLPTKKWASQKWLC